MSRPIVGAVLAFAGLLASAATGRAQGFDVQLLRPNPDLTEPYFVMGTAHPKVDRDYSVGVLLDFARNPLVLYGSDGERLASIVANQLTGYATGGYAFAERLSVGLAVPVILSQSGDDVAYVPAAPKAGAGIGDIRVVPRVVVYTQTTDPREPKGFSLAIDGELFIPTGSREDFQGEGFRIAPRATAELNPTDALRVAASLGYEVRPKANLLNLAVNDMVKWNLGSAYALTDRLVVSGELHGGASVLAKEIDAEEVPLELLVGGRHRPFPYLTILAGAGFGLVQGAGAPDWRVFVGAAFNNSREPEPPDRDGDGILDVADKCPDVPEDKDGFEDEDGCPDPDNDQDGILDTADRCPNVPEDKDGFEDEDGCPDPDNDVDGLLDQDDKCPNDAEDRDGLKDEDGCPEEDADNDQVLDPADKCPLEPETLNGFDDQDGCPDQGGKVLVTCAKIEIREKVFFDTAKATIQQRSFALLDQIAAVLVQAKNIKKLRIEGHTDDRGNDDYNMGLSNDRAASVRSYLVAHGVDEARLDFQGFGETKPIASNGTDRGREQNRRVEFFIAEQEVNPSCVGEPAAAP